MNFTFFASVVGVLGILGILIRRGGGDDIEARENFWERESRANFVRKVSLDNLDYVTIPEYLLNVDPANTTTEIKSCINQLIDFSHKKIVNLNGISNTDLKLKYGTANITVLSEYDENYINLIVLLQKYAELLNEAGEKQLAINVLEFAVSTNTDISKTYYLLSDLYKEKGTPEKSEYLIQKASTLNSIMKDAIVRNLKASGQ